MNKKRVLEFYTAFGYEPTPAQAELLKDMLNIWGRFEKSAAKNPALLRKGILFGMGLAFSLMAGKTQAVTKGTEAVMNDM